MDGSLFVLELVQFVFGSMDATGDKDVVSKIGDGEVVVFKDSVG